jgi:hypothetical protein
MVVMAGVELAEPIAQLRAEHSEAMRIGENAGLRFELGPVELELALSVGKDGGAGGKVRFRVAELGADGRASRTSTQRIKLVLDPGGPACRNADRARRPPTG